MGPTLVLLFLGAFSLLIVKAIVQRRLNPYGDVAWDGLPEALRTEIERVLPGFSQSRARLTSKGDEAHVEGSYQGERLRIEADFDRSGTLVEFEVEGARGARTRRTVSPEAIPAAARCEVERVLGEHLPRFERSVVLGGTTAGAAHYAVKGYADDWKWEISVDEQGRLLEVEKELRRASR